MENATRQEDAEVVRRVLDGDVNAFRFLVERYGDLVVGVVRKHVPVDYLDDTVQDAFFRAYRSLPTFKNGSFPVWLSVISVRACYDFWRERYRCAELPVSAFTERHQAWLEEALSGASSESYREKGLQKEAGEILDYALAKLSPGDRMALELVYLEGRSIKEAAALLGWTSANVKVRLFRSRMKLRGLLTKQNGKRSDR
jgi:RNA polymerase sigma-70 factor (ECF subfamily)